MNDNTLDNPFWQYACALYQKPGISLTLLKLQDEHNFNIPIVLLLVWLGTQGIAVTSTHIHHFMAITAEPDTLAVRPLRTIRRFIKSCDLLSPTLYEQIKALELSMEQQIMASLYQQAMPIFSKTNATSCVEQNLSFYVLANGNDPQELMYTLLVQLK